MAFNYHQIQKHTAALVASGKPFWLIVNPTSEKPPTLAFPTKESAWEGAEFFAAKWPGSQFFVMQARGFAKTGNPPVERTIIERKPKGKENGGCVPIRERFGIGDRVTGTDCCGEKGITGVVVEVDSRDDLFTYRIVDEKYKTDLWMTNKGLRWA